MKTECTGIIGRVFGHSYAPRYSYGAPNFSRLKGFSSDAGLSAAIEATKERTYIADVCTRCGHKL